MVYLNKDEILDSFNKGKWVLLNYNNKTRQILEHELVTIEGKKAIVDDIAMSERNNRLALTVRYQEG